MSKASKKGDIPSSPTGKLGAGDADYLTSLNGLSNASAAKRKPRWKDSGFAKFINEENHLKALGIYLEHFFDKTQLKANGQGAQQDLTILKHLLLRDIERIIADIDLIVIEVVNKLIHHPSFQNLESRWRGLWSLVLAADGHRNMRVRMLDISKRECARDLERAIEFDQSQLFNKIYNEAYGIAGGEPFGLIVTDFSVQHKPGKIDDINLMRSLAEVGAAAFTPIVVNVDPQLFGLNDHSELTSLVDVHALFQQSEYQSFRTLRRSLDTRFLVLTLPRVLMRERYRSVRKSFNGLSFEECCTSHEHYLWGAASYALGVIALREFAAAGWFGHIRGAPQNKIAGGLVSHVIPERFYVDDKLQIIRPITELRLSDTMERKLSAEGLMPLIASRESPYAVFYNNSTLWDASSASGSTNYDDATLSGMLQHVLCASRVAHYVKVIIRDKIGSFSSADECERALGEWIYQYTTGNEDLGWEEQARYPLKKAEVQVREQASKPGQYSCIMRLMPHYQADEMRAELELVTELVQGS